MSKLSDALVTALEELPEAADLAAIQANAASGYYETQPARNLAIDLRALSYEPEATAAIAAREALATRAEAGEFGGVEPQDALPDAEAPPPPPPPEE